MRQKRFPAIPMATAGKKILVKIGKLAFRKVGKLVSAVGSLKSSKYEDFVDIISKTADGVSKFNDVFKFILKTFLGGNDFENK
jgi:hypothetical protein